MSSLPPSRSAIADLRDRDLVRLYWPVELRPAFDALFAIDDAMADVVTKATEPTLAAIKLAWWRERLEELDHGKVPAEPRLRAAASELLPRGIAGAKLADLEAGWAELLQPVPNSETVSERGIRLFEIAVRLLGANDIDPSLGEQFALADAARRGLLDRPVLKCGPPIKVERRQRPVAALAVLARRPPTEPEATPGRALALLRHRLTGRY